ncbi:hypothetical protein HN011_000884 [Eciton burchellii]|nr:hypothetical protein HN011_000884 [Eciton burchellii]
MISATSSDIRGTRRAGETSVARDTSSISARVGQPGGSHEELLEEVLGKQILQIIVHALVLVRRTGLAHAEDRQTEMLHLDARLDCRPPRVVAALRVPVAVRCAPVMMMIAWRTRGLGLVRSPITPAEFPGLVKSRPISSLKLRRRFNAPRSFVKVASDEHPGKIQATPLSRKTRLLSWVIANRWK